MDKTKSETTDLDYAGKKEESGDEEITGEQTAVLEEKLRIITFKVYEKKLVDVWNRFRADGIETVLIKGWAAASNYPNPFRRRLGDFDLAVNPKDFEKAAILQKNLKLGEVDLHKGLRRHDTVEWDDLFENSILKECGGTLIRILRPEDHLRILCVHWLVDGGREKEKLRDIFYAVENRPSNFDWERCLGIIGRKRRKWIIYTIGLTRKYFGLSTDDLPFSEESKKLPRWLIKTVEKEWNNPVEFKYLQSCLGSREEFFKQLGRRFPPNPIQATVNMEGDFDSSTRILYQVGDLFGRFTPSIRRVLNVLRSKHSLLL